MSKEPPEWSDGQKGEKDEAEAASFAQGPFSSRKVQAYWYGLLFLHEAPLLITSLFLHK